MAKTPQAQMLLLVIFLHVDANDTAKSEPQKIKQNYRAPRAKAKGIGAWVVFCQSCQCKARVKAGASISYNQHLAA